MQMSAVKSGRFYKKLSKNITGTKRARRRAVRFGLVGVNLCLLAGVGLFVAGTAGKSGAEATHLAATANSTVAGPLDQLSSTDIAVNVARSVNLPESVAVTNQSDSAAIMNEVAAADTAVVAKPQVIATSAKSASEIKTYIVVLGDTVSSIAAKFNVTSDSIRWSNGLNGEAVRVGTELVIPPANGIVYTVRPGDTADSLAQRFKASKDQIIAFNDAELAGLVVGKRIVIPNGQVVASVASYRYSGIGSFSPAYGYNGYDRGWCTWYVANRISVPTNWGNANTWDDRARLSGWTVSGTPQPGAVAQSNRGSMGHVAVVEAVSPDGTMIKYSDMNGIAGFNRVGYSDWVPVSKFQNYIYR